MDDIRKLRSVTLIGAVVIVSSGAFAIACSRPTPVPSGPNDTRPPAGSVAATEAGTVTQLATGTKVSAPSLFVDHGGTVHATWRAGLTDDAVIVYRNLAQSSDWMEAVVLSEGLTYAGRPSLRARPDGTVCLTWWGARGQASGLYQRCRDDARWTGAEQIEAGLTGSFTAVTTADGVVHTLRVAGSGVRVDDRELNGQPHGGVFDGRLVAAGGVLHVLWLDDALRYRQSADGGQTWSEVTVIGRRGWTRVDAATDVAGGLHVVFDGPDGLTYRYRAPGGAWRDPELVLPDDIAAHRAVVVGPDRQPRIFVARSNGIDRIVRREDDWVPAVRVSSLSTPVAEIAAAVDAEDDVHLIWITPDMVVWYTELIGVIRA
jgi:hypothetical protein